MGFKLRSQNEPPASNAIRSNTAGLNFGSSKANYGSMSKSLSASNQNKKKLDPTGKKAGSWVNDDDTVEQYMDDRPVLKGAIQLADPTGVSSYNDVKKAWTDGKLDRKDVLEPLGALPAIGKIAKTVSAGIKLTKTVGKTAKVGAMALGALAIANKIGDANTIGNMAGNRPKNKR